MEPNVYYYSIFTYDGNFKYYENTIRPYTGTMETLSAMESLDDKFHQLTII